MKQAIAAPLRLRANKKRSAAQRAQRSVRKNQKAPEDRGLRYFRLQLRVDPRTNYFFFFAAFFLAGAFFAAFLVAYFIG